MPRKAKLDTDDDDRKYQRERTEKLKALNESDDLLAKDAPKFLDAVGSSMYRQLVKKLNDTGYAIKSDQPLVESFAMAYSVMRQAWAEIQDKGTTYTNENGRIYANPAVGQLDVAQKQLKSVANELGLSPQSRASLVGISSDPEDDVESTSELEQRWRRGE